MKSQTTIDISKDLATRQRKKALSLLRQAFEANHATKGQGHKPKPQLKQLITEMKVERMKQKFYKRLTLNNIYQSPCQIQLLSQKQKDSKRLLKWKGFRVQRHFLSLVFIFEIMFLVITFFISSCMAFLNNFVQRDVHNSLTVLILNALTVIFSLFKIIITSTSQKVKEGILIVYITDIIQDYARSFILFVDLIYLGIMISVFISRIGSAALVEQLSLVLFLWSIIRIGVSSQNLTLFRTTFVDSFMKEQYFKLSKLVIFNFIFAHFIASMLIAMSKLDNTVNWMVSSKIYHEEWYVQYMWSYYWATTIMMTVGFGDFLPITFKEGFIVSFLQFFSCIVLAYNISEIGGIISTIRSTQNEYVSKIAIFKRMAQKNEIDLELKLRIESYLREEKQIKEKFEFNQQNELLQALPQPLKKQFIMASNGKIFSYLPFFKHLHKNTVILLASRFIPKVYYPRENLVKARQYNDSIIILKEGKVGLAYKRQQSLLNGIIVQEIQILKRQFLTNQGQYTHKMIPVLLTPEFLSPGKIINYDLNALTYSYAFNLSHQNFLQIIRQNDMDLEYFFSITHAHGSSKISWEQLPCQHCSIYKQNPQTNYLKKFEVNMNDRFDENFELLQYHSKFQCPRLHYTYLEGVIILRYIKTTGKTQQNKPEYQRKKARSESCLLQRKIAFKQYERKRFINEKKVFEKLVQKSVFAFSMKLKQKKKKKSSGFRVKTQRKNSDGPYNTQGRKLSWQDQKYDAQLDNEKKVDSESNRLLEINESHMAMTETDDKKSLIQSVVTYAMKEIYPKYISLHFWDVQIDIISNYLNYFPNENAARLDMIEINKNKTHYNKALCLIGTIINSQLIKANFAIQRARSYTRERIHRNESENEFKRQKSLEINVNSLQDLNSNRSSIPTYQPKQWNHKKIQEEKIENFLQKKRNEKITIKPITKTYDRDESIVMEEDIDVVVQGDNSEFFLGSSNQLNQFS